MRHHELTEETSVEDCERLLSVPPGPWPSGNWVGFPNVIQAVRNLLARIVKDPPPPPRWERPRGIVICGGGWNFFPSVYVTVRVIRHVGCTLPIQVWFLGDRGEFDPRMLELTKQYGVGWIDANSFWRENPWMQLRGMNVNHGWMLKPYAVAGAPFAEVLSLDADSYPVYNPEGFMSHPEYRRVGACFWPDFNPLEPGQWDRFGVPRTDRAGFESGQFMVDKERHWAPLCGAMLLNCLHDFTYRHVYGDKDTFNLAWGAAGHETCVPSNRPKFHVHSFVQLDFAGNPLFIHRTRDKFRLTGEIDGQGIPQQYMTRQKGPVNRHCPGLPHEDFCFMALRKCDQDLRPERYFDLLGSEMARDVWLRINRSNEYRFADNYGGKDVAVDVGANLGAASHALLERGMGHVFAVEPHPWNYERIGPNLSSFPGRMTLLPVACWRSDVCPATVPCWFRHDGPGNSCWVNSFLPFGDTLHAPAVPLDDILERAAASGPGRVRLLKIDTEGAEYPCLLTSKRLDLVDEIIGEYHEQASIPDHAAVAGFPRFDKPTLLDFLRGQGFALEDEPFSPIHGLFWARRPAAG